LQRKRQFSGVTKPRAFFDRRVRVEGFTRSISMGKIIPKGWEYVRLTVKEKSDNKIVVQIEKLLGGENNVRKDITSEP
jgi:hypothetical protein